MHTKQNLQGCPRHVSLLLDKQQPEISSRIEVLKWGLTHPQIWSLELLQIHLLVNPLKMTKTTEPPRKHLLCGLTSRSRKRHSIQRASTWSSTALSSGKTFIHNITKTDHTRKKPTTAQGNTSTTTLGKTSTTKMLNLVCNTMNILCKLLWLFLHILFHIWSLHIFRKNFCFARSAWSFAKCGVEVLPSVLWWTRVLRTGGAL